MKFNRIQFIFLVGLLITSSVSGLRNICKYKGRQMTLGQKMINCYVIISCEKNGVIKIQDSCPKYSCVRPTKPLGYKVFDASEPYPRCCGGPICEGQIISHKISKGTYIVTAE
ncbi:uncharacterized protein LOC107263757 [Cephus cinctus]|uniref:Uncharacterized protein LOC107263757 n=1 Tax=Cephus cinctus TaxID=211228 RepID=A0AAJ7BIC2_CEPCN|nr:uncharacterized protein LOC107263757 [Cephus cinctus]